MTLSADTATVRTPVRVSPVRRVAFWVMVLAGPLVWGFSVVVASVVLTIAPGDSGCVVVVPGAAVAATGVVFVASLVAVLWLVISPLPALTYRLAAAAVLTLFLTFLGAVLAHVIAQDLGCPVDDPGLRQSTGVSAALTP